MKFKLIIDKSREEEVVVLAHSASELTQQIEQLVRNYVGEDEIVVHGDYGLVRLKYEDISCITVLYRKLYVIDNHGEQYRVSGTLSDFEQRIPGYFIRINKSSIANEKQILRFSTTFSGGVDAVFKCGYKDYVSRRCFAEIKRRYN